MREIDRENKENFYNKTNITSLYIDSNNQSLEYALIRYKDEFRKFQGTFYQNQTINIRHFNDRFDEKISLILKETAQNIKQRKEYTMCEYCQNQLEKDIYNYKDDVDSHYIYVYDNLLCIELNFDYSKSFAKHVEINYCPMCGRKL